MTQYSIAIAASAWGLASTMSGAQVIDAKLEEPAQLSVAQLKSAYLDCDRASVRVRLAAPGIMQCSIVYEELKRRAFDGDFDKLLAWFQASKDAEPRRQ